MSVYIKDMEMPVDCLACRIACDKESYMVVGRPPKCPLAEAPDGDLIGRAETIEAVELMEIFLGERKKNAVVRGIQALPSAETHDKRTETHGVCSDLISRTDAMAYPLSWEHYDKENGSREFICGVESYREYIENLPSADAVQTQAEKCDECIHNGAHKDKMTCKECVSAKDVQRWIPFTRRPMTEEEQKDYPNCTFMFDCVLPDDGDEILVSNRRFVWMDVFCNDVDGCYLDSGDDIDEDMAWMPLPEAYKGGGNE